MALELHYMIPILVIVGLQNTVPTRALCYWQFYSSIYLVPDSLLRTQKLSPFLGGIFVGYSSSKDIVVFWSVV